jgi:hypothetical protein
LGFDGDPHEGVVAGLVRDRLEHLLAAVARRLLGQRGGEDAGLGAEVVVRGERRRS